MSIDSGMVAKTTRRALVKAQGRHEAWSGWWWAPPEYVATVEIAQAVYGLDDVTWVTPEHNVRDALRRAGGGMGRPAAVLPKQGRFDIVVWEGYRPKGVIEVKTRGYATLHQDVARVCAALRNARGISWGLVAFIYAWGDGREKQGRDRVRDRTDSLATEAQDVAYRERMAFTRHKGRTCRRDDGAWAAEVFEIRRSTRDR